MCKNFACVSFKDSNLMFNILDEASPILREHDNHATGYAIYSNKTKQLFGERFVLETNGTFPKKLEANNYNFFGEPEYEETTAGILHTRFATGPKTIENTHPFIKDDTYLIHNGVVSEHGLEYYSSTCDSEGILNAYNELDIANNPNRFKYLTQLLDGWYACILIAKVNGKYVVDVFKDGRSNLTVTKIKGVDGLVYCTSEAHIKKILANLKLEAEYTKDVETYKLIRHDIVTGEIIGTWAGKDRDKYTGKTTRYTGWTSYDDDYNDDVWDYDKDKQRCLEAWKNHDDKKVKSHSYLDEKEIKTLDLFEDKEYYDKNESDEAYEQKIFNEILKRYEGEIY